MFCGGLRHFAAFCGVLQCFVAFSAVFFVARQFSNHLRHIAAFYGVLRHFPAFSGLFRQVGDKFPVRVPNILGGSNLRPLFWLVENNCAKWGGSGPSPPLKTFFWFLLEYNRKIEVSKVKNSYVLTTYLL